MELLFTYESLLQLLHATLQLRAMFVAKFTVDFLDERVDADRERRLRCEHARNLRNYNVRCTNSPIEIEPCLMYSPYLALELGVGLPNERRVVDETVLGSVMLRLESAKQRLLRSEDLYGRRRMLGEVEERTCTNDGDVSAYTANITVRLSASANLRAR